MSKALLFCHPGSEHVPPRSRGHDCARYRWNQCHHRRKFMLVRATTDGSPGETREVGLWGEWEAPSCAGRFARAESFGWPQAWHRPLFEATGDPPPRAKNTDPWIFGDHMRYAICRQAKHEVLRTLERGDVLFFGSLKKRDANGKRAAEFNFFLDTVFVVASRLPYTRSEMPRDVDALYRHATLDRIVNDIPENGLVLYDGATRQNPVDGMFSFVPCKPVEADLASARFARPMINGLWRVSLRNPQLPYKEIDGVQARDAWAAVAERCRDRNLEKAVRVDARPAQAAQLEQAEASAA